ncbi:response regulator [Sporomusa acidovorans]|uniref:Protein-glutamate methylesterase/protein-glutamine glutaminase n=1 Tax=Sporomusa acidovorans (strain ATCC 49682 / DSM 3132 / Mol) TaxID=1123286 RepID=A0ABZ3IZY1_SPOA4|nr:response regulator [Sporomusa acidovorans]OZC18323.1 chemotaxis protein CheY [Sporomusa acidovorans DSM 3132]SDF19987.1 Two-component response regulator, YesN/AraC family, consists of REC and AraC-type DNA-binding domains [Sporomusa acidovorans]
MANILIVDDSMMERKILGDIITALGHNVIGQAKNGEQAVEEYLKLKPDLVTMDLTMKISDGAEAISKIIAADPQACIVVVSSHQEKQIIGDALERGARHFIIKPVSLQKVSAVISTVLQQPFDKDRHLELISHLKAACNFQEKPKRHSARILIADDSTFARQMLRDVVIALGHVVVGEATNGAQAFVEYARLKPDLVTMDLTMQGLGGAETISKIMAAYPDARIIVISAIETRAGIIDALERGARHFIVKPICQEKVAAAIENVLQQKFDLQKQLSSIHKLKSNEAMRAIVDAETEYEAPYAISTQDNFIHVFIYQSLTLTSCQTLMAELSEYLDGRPRLLLNFGTMSKLESPLFDQFNELAKLIENNLGVVQAISYRKEFVESIANKTLGKNANLLAEVLRYSEN